MRFSNHVRRSSSVSSRKEFSSHIQYEGRRPCKCVKILFRSYAINLKSFIFVLYKSMTSALTSSLFGSESQSILEPNRISHRIFSHTTDQIKTLEKIYQCKLFNALNNYISSVELFPVHRLDFHENVKFSLFNVMDDCALFIHNFFDIRDYFTLSQVCYSAFIVYFPLNAVGKTVLHRVIWNELDNSLNGMICNGETTETANYMYRLLTFVNHMRFRRMMDPIPTLGCLMYKRYERAIEPLLLLQALLFNTEIIHRISVNIIKEGYRRCSFGLNCDKGVLCFLMHSGDRDNFFIGEFVFCLNCVHNLRMNSVLY